LRFEGDGSRFKSRFVVDVAEFISFIGLPNLTTLRTVTRAHVIAWRKDTQLRKLAPASVCHELSAYRRWRQAAGGEWK